jgi:hypothetical protein
MYIHAYMHIFYHTKIIPKKLTQGKGKKEDKKQRKK